MELGLEDIKKELKDYYSNQTIINEYEKANDKIERLIDRATYTGPVISDMPKGSSAIQDKKAELVAEYVDLQRNVIELEREYAVGLMKLKNNNLIVHHTIMKLKSPFKAILMHIYINNMTRDKAAEVMGKSRKWLDTMIGVAYMEYLKTRNENL